MIMVALVSLGKLGKQNRRPVFSLLQNSNAKSNRKTEMGTVPGKCGYATVQHPSEGHQV